MEQMNKNTDKRVLLNHFWRITYSHTIAYFIAGILALSILDYKSLFSLEIMSFMRPIDTPIVALAPLLQVFRGLIIALILLPLRKTFFEEKHGLFKLAWVMVGFSLLSTFAAAPGSFEGFLYTVIPFQYQIIGYPEAIVYISLFMLLLYVSQKFEKKKIVNILAILFILLIGFMSTMGFMVLNGMINIK